MAKPKTAYEGWCLVSAETGKIIKLKEWSAAPVIRSRSLARDYKDEFCLANSVTPTDVNIVSCKIIIG